MLRLTDGSLALLWSSVLYGFAEFPVKKKLSCGDLLFGQAIGAISGKQAALSRLSQHFGGRLRAQQSCLWTFPSLRHPGRTTKIATVEQHLVDLQPRSAGKSATRFPGCRVCVCVCQCVSVCAQTDCNSPLREEAIGERWSWALASASSRPGRP